MPNKVDCSCGVSAWPAYLQTMVTFSCCVVHAISDTEMKVRIQGVASQMHNFKFLFGLILCEMILRHTDKLSRTLQQPTLSSVEGHEVPYSGKFSRVQIFAKIPFPLQKKFSRF